MSESHKSNYFDDSAASIKEEELRELGYGTYLDSPFLQRLKGVSFLGVLDYIIGDSRISSRYTHTIFVSYLALELSRKLKLSPDYARAFIIAHILHDIGHAAFSHNSEPFLLERMNLYHQGLLSAYLTRSNKFAPSGIPLNDLLSSESTIIADIVRSLILKSRKAPQPLDDLFNCPLNCDKIEGNHRTALHLQRGSVDPDQLLNVFEVCSGDVFILSNHIDLVMEFWDNERKLYWNDIYTSEVFSAEAMLTRCLDIFFRQGGRVEDFILMTDAEASAAISRNEGASCLLQQIKDKSLFMSMTVMRPDLIEGYGPELRKHRFDAARRTEIEQDIAGVLNVELGTIISHFSRRKHFELKLDGLKQSELFDVLPGLTPLQRVVDSFRNSKRSGDFFDIFWKGD